jgi:hypothetical protein
MAEYPNRSDLRNPATLAVKAAPGQTYGEAGKQIAAQQAVPMGTPPTEMPPITPIGAPTERPNEPMTAGMDFGPGPGSNVLSTRFAPAIGSRQDLMERVRVLAAQYPNPNLLALLEVLENGQ